MEIKDYVEERVLKNQLPLVVVDCVKLIDKYEEIYPEVDSMKRFFYVVLNKVGAILSTVDKDLNELLGWIKVRGKNSINFYEFEDEGDYLNWLQGRQYLYEKLTNVDDIRLLNFLELSTMNFISDINTNCKYQLSKDNDIIIFNKVEYGTDNSNVSFIKYLGGKFKEGYNFKPIK